MKFNSMRYIYLFTVIVLMIVLGCRDKPKIFVEAQKAKGEKIKL